MDVRRKAQHAIFMWMIVEVLKKTGCVWQHVKYFFKCKRKGKYFQILGCILKIALENIFRCFVAF